ncbi:hypothetical protein CHUAL_007886 [Chamberlinius hualienensis]
MLIIINFKFLLAASFAILMLTTLIVASPEETSAVDKVNPLKNANPNYFQLLGRCVRRYGHACLGGHGKRSNTQSTRGNLSEGPMDSLRDVGEMKINRDLMDLLWKFNRMRHPTSSWDESA